MLHVYEDAFGKYAFKNNWEPAQIVVSAPSESVPVIAYVIVMEPDPVHPDASVAVTETVDAVDTEMFGPEAPVLHA